MGYFDPLTRAESALAAREAPRPSDWNDAEDCPGAGGAEPGESTDFRCTECNEPAFVRYSNWTGPQGQVIGKDESLCPRCAKKRRISIF